MPTCEICFRDSFELNWSGRLAARTCLHCHLTEKPMPKFTGAKEPVFFVKQGDYVFCVVGMTIKVSQGARTAGSEQYEVKCQVEGSDSHFYDTLTVHESCIWRLENFLKSTGNELKPGEDWSFDEMEAQRNGWRYIKPLGLRGHVNLRVEEFPEDSKRFQNKVTAYLVGKPKLPPREIAEPEDDIPF